MSIITATVWTVLGKATRKEKEIEVGKVRREVVKFIDQLLSNKSSAKPLGKRSL